MKERVLPPLDDELAKTATEFDTLDELRAEIEGRLRAQIDDELGGRVPRRRGRRARQGVERARPPARSSSCATRELLTGLARSLEAARASTPARTSS